MKKIILLSLLLLSTLAVAKPQYPGFYVGGDIGTTRLSFDDLSGSDSAVSFGAYGGYNVNEWFGIEGHLYGTTDYSDVNGENINAGVFSVTPTFTLNFNDMFSGYLKGGISYIDISFEQDTAYWGTYTNDLTGIGYVLGAGVDAAVSEHIVIRLAYEFTSGDLEFDNNYYYYDRNYQTNLSQFSLGVHYLF
ncbi:outer membrane protein [Shewanella surugensis]|uniref:Outer membrane beta-barrel protein n=1 Tax=Shewanella surugensis TaxID=212020 RepID=A0ABT0LDZ7_9GAMM|nr:outer membrane beta-barrel protein [Shewanella surugensis]MCL1125927.1 outer membrane beta-barrel protein [Shewanella surugensis]